MKPISEQIEDCVPEWNSLVYSLIPSIEDDYRASDEDTKPSMQLTIGFTPETEDKDHSWSFQTGDNSFTGGAYHHPHWAVVSLYRDSVPAKIAEEIASQIAELCYQ